MSKTSILHNSFKVLLIIFLIILFEGCSRDQVQSSEPDDVPDYEGKIVALGDSLTAGLNVIPSEAYPALLEKKLRGKGYMFEVINAGISGETSSGALSRIKWILIQEPDMVILETGANDGLRGIDPELTKKNIDSIIQILKQNNVIVVLAGMNMVLNLGEIFTSAFAKIFPDVAGTHGIILIPFFLDGVAGEPGLNQGDGIHPNASGYTRVTETVYPYVIRGIESIRNNIEKEVD
ncbi:MAG: arylesterase [Desulfobacterales bacterium]|nr:arylesterase [Desulfobacterales bacterium]